MTFAQPTRVCFALFVLCAIAAPGCRGNFCGPIAPACPPAEDDAGCTGRRFIAITDPALPCPKDPLPSPIWKEGKLFKGFGAKVPPPLARYCVYEWTGAFQKNSQCKPYGPSGPGDVELNYLKNTILTPSTELGEDCIDSAPLQSTFETQADTWARQELFSHAGGVNPLPTAPSTPRPVRLVAIDTAPTSTTAIGVGQSRHGDTVAYTAKDLACPNGEASPCAAHVRTKLGLPRTDLANPLTTNVVQGGFFGTEGDLAQAIEGAVSTWHNDIILGTAEPRLVLNLSVGWEDDQERNNCEPANLRTNLNVLSPPARSVVDALRYASCHGALVLAAAGNDTGGPLPSSGLVCPARWEALDAPDTTSCNEMVGTEFPQAWAERFNGYPLRESEVQGRSYNRLVYAVGGVDYSDEPLLPVRRGGRPRLAGLGLMGAAWDNSSVNGTAPPPYVTGTSIATAVASAIASSVWSYNPARTAPSILDAIYTSGLPLQRGGANIVADSGTCLGAASCDVRRVSLCRAIGVPCVDQVLADSLQNPAMSAPFSAALATAYSSVVATNLTFAPGAANPHTQYPTVAASPWSFPQPSWPACPACIAQIPNPNEIELYARTTIPMSGVTVVLVNASGAWSLARVQGGVLAGSPIRVRIQMGKGAASAVRKVLISGTTMTATGATVSVTEQVVLSGP